MFFDKNGILSIDETVMHNPSWQKIMSDGIVTEDELLAQAETVTKFLQS